MYYLFIYYKGIGNCSNVVNTVTKKSGNSKGRSLVHEFYFFVAKIYFLGNPKGLLDQKDSWDLMPNGLLSYKMSINT